MDFRFVRIFRGKKIVKSCVALDSDGVFLAKIQCPRKKGFLYFIQNIRYFCHEPVFGDRIFFPMGPVAPGHENTVLRDVPGTDFNPQWYTLFDPVPASGAADIPLVDFNHEFTVVIKFFPQLCSQAFSVIHDALSVSVLADDRQQHHVGRSDPGRQKQTVVVTVGHDQPADKAGGRPPGGGPDVIFNFIGRLKLNF